MTERAIFRLTESGLVLEEVAPGIDIDKDVLWKMEFNPIVSHEIKEMDESLFKEGKLGLTDEIIEFLGN